MRPKYTFIAAVAATIVFVDITTKALALTFLSESDAPIGTAFQLQLSVNRSLASETSLAGVNYGRILVVTAAQAAAVLVVWRRSLRSRTAARSWSWLLGAIIIGAGVGSVLPVPSLEPSLAGAVSRFGFALAPLLLAARIASTRLTWFGVALLLGGNAGNTIGLAISDGIVDFIYIPALSDHIGVFNVADMALKVGKATFAIALARFAWLSLFSRKSPR